MGTVAEKSTDALAELIIINNDRSEGYKTAAEETTDSELKALFNKFSMQSRGFSEELRKLIPFKEETPKRDETKFSGKFFRAWMDVKAALTGKSKKAILSSCETGEDVALKTYNDILDNPEDISQDLISLLKRQKSELQQSHDQIKVMRDMA
ncbi:MAG: PA2169 family four-helix-bundle protein [Bacteroidetes bacterium]|nr:PA2169 family four-helix-bundle protein [Bacteroidota bacterium]